MRKSGICLLFVVACGISLVGCGGAPSDGDGGKEPETFQLPAPADKYAPLPGYGRMTIPADNPMTLDKAELGRQLFFDERLSGDGKLSCYSCHLNEKGLSDGRPTAIGAFEKKLTRNSPTLWNIGFHSLYYWDGRKDTLEGQAAAAWTGGNMGAKDTAKVVALINGVTAYKEQFQSVFNGPATEENIPQALACYMRTIISKDTPWDRYLAGDQNAVSDAAKRGHEVFKKFGCEECHSGVLFTDQIFHNVGIGLKADDPDVGHYKVTKNDMHMNAFKTPTLRDVVDSGPYFHDGSVPTLKMAVEIMLMGGMANPHLDEKLVTLKAKGLKATQQEKDDLMAFLEALDEPSELLHPEVPK